MSNKGILTTLLKATDHTHTYQLLPYYVNVFLVYDFEMDEVFEAISEPRFTKEDLEGCRFINTRGGIFSTSLIAIIKVKPMAGWQPLIKKPVQRTGLLASDLVSVLNGENPFKQMEVAINGELIEKQPHNKIS